MGKQKKNSVCGVYKITNIINGKFYIGSSVNITKRWWEHKKHLKRKIHCNPHLSAAWNIHGEKSFLFEVVRHVQNKEDLLTVEQSYIDKYWDGGKQCYNISKVADKPDSDFNKIPINQLDVNTRRVIKTWDSAADVEEAMGIRANCIYQCCKGNRVMAKKFSWEYAEPALSSLYSVRRRKGKYNKKPVYQYDFETGNLIGEYSSLQDASDKTGICRVKISGNCRGLLVHAKQFVFSTEKKECFKNIASKKEKACRCCLCPASYGDLKSLATHIQFYHHMSSERYTELVIYKGVRPTCAICPNFTRYVRFSYKKYCKAHSTEAMILGGKMKNLSLPIVRASSTKKVTCVPLF
jgi:hypothetical protein